MAKGTRAGVHRQWGNLLKVFGKNVPMSKSVVYNYRYVLREVFK